MSHFYGTLDGSRGQVTRCGTKNSGLTATTASWQGAVRTDITHNSDTGVDHVTVSLIPWRGKGINKVLFEGPISGQSIPEPELCSAHLQSCDDDGFCNYCGDQ